MSARPEVPVCRDVYRVPPPEHSTLSAVSRVTVSRSAAVDTDDTVLLEVLLPVHSKLEDREEACRSLGLFLQTGYGGASSLARRVCLRLTDPTDPFFLFEMELHEDDYGSFKQKLELRVDFSEFPKYLSSMFNDIFSGNTPYSVSFIVDSRDTTHGTLRVLERTEFRTVEHISLILLRQGDGGQKRYLAERFRHFERAYFNLADESRRAAAAAAADMDTLRKELASLQEERDVLQKRLEAEITKSEKNQLTSVGQLREEHASQLSHLRASLESEIRHVSQKADSEQKRLMSEICSKEKALCEAGERIESMESLIKQLQGELRAAKNDCINQTKELESLRSANEKLQSFQMEATQNLSDNKLNNAKLQERLRGLVHALRTREEEHKSLREQFDKQDNYVRILASDNEQLQEQKKKGEISLAKAHHIISTQLKHIRELKARGRMMRGQVSSLHSLLQEKSDGIARLRDELASSTERYQIAQNKCAELREQLEKTDAAREKLVHELKQTQDALIHLQRSTSINARHWSVVGAPNTSGIGTSTSTSIPSAGLGVGLSGTHMPASLGMYREFNKNATATFPSLHSGTGDSGGASTTKPSPPFSGMAGDKSEKGVPVCSQDGGEKRNPQHVLPASSASGDSRGQSVATGSMGDTSSTVVHNKRGVIDSNWHQTDPPIDSASQNGTLSRVNQSSSARSFLGDCTIKQYHSANVASFFGNPLAVTTEAAPSAYF